MNETTTCHDYHGFEWQNINIYLILIIFLYDLTPFLVRWIVTTPLLFKMCGQWWHGFSLQLSNDYVLNNMVIDMWLKNDYHPMT